MKYIVDRIERNYAVCQNENGLNEEIPLEKFDFPVEEGNHMDLINGKFILNIDEAEKQRQKNINLQNSLFE